MMARVFGEHLKLCRGYFNGELLLRLFRARLYSCLMELGDYNGKKIEFGCKSYLAG